MIIYTDGAYSSKTNRGGWAYVIVQSNHTICNNGGEFKTTNNRMELTALLQALKICSTINEHHTIYTDSAYIANCFDQKWYIKWRANGWRNAAKEPVKNQDLWEQILALYNPSTISISKVKGHENDQYNILADKLAVEGRTKL